MTQPAPAACSLFAPAKLNLGLRVVGRRADGYHELESLFLPIAFGDEVRVERIDGGPPGVAFTLEGGTPDVPADARNLAVRAAEAFLEAAGLRASVRVRLRKRVPGAAGLGGGSSDAAAVLRALARLFPGAVEEETLAALGLRLGADVPFFLQDPIGPARVEGVGERVTPLARFPDVGILLAHPGLPLSTRPVFEAYDALSAALTPHRAGSTIRRPSGLRDLADLRDLVDELGSGLLANDLEPAAIRLCPPIARLRDLLRACAALEGAAGVGMSGSGPTVFALFEDVAAAGKARNGLELAAPAWGKVTERYRPAALSPQGIHGASPNW